MHALSSPVAARLKALAGAARAEAPPYQISAKGVAGALICLASPETPEALFELFAEYAETREYWTGAEGRGGTTNVTLVLPAPVSQRLDLLVSGARRHRDLPVRRRDMLGALILLRAPSTASEMIDLYKRYAGLHAEDVAVPFAEPEAVLANKPPRAGRRPGPNAQPSRRRAGSR